MSIAGKSRLHLGSGKRFRVFLIFFLVQTLASPFLVDSLAGGYLDDLLFYAVLILGLRSVREEGERGHFIGRALFVVFALMDVSNYFLNSQALLVAANCTGGAVLCFTMWKMFIFIANQKKVDADTVYGGLCIYLLIGVLWCIVYITLEILHPGSFDFTIHKKHESLLNIYWLLSYFSYTTLMTIGFGDIAPLTSVAQTFVILEGMVGQFYLVFFMARLVGLYIVQKSERRGGERRPAKTPEEPPADP